MEQDMMRRHRKKPLHERFVNFVGTNDEVIERRRQYLDEVWDMLRKSYAPIGGIKGRGFESKEAILRLPFWKVIKRNGEVVGVVIYKDSNGRKAVASGTNGTPEAKEALKMVVKSDVKVSFGEKSKAALVFAIRVLGDEIMDYLIPVDVARKYLKHDITPLTEIPEDEWPHDAQTMIARYPFLREYGYIRSIGGEPTFKVMIGTPGIPIEPR